MGKQPATALPEERDGKTLPANKPAEKKPQLAMNPTLRQAARLDRMLQAMPEGERRWVLAWLCGQYMPGASISLTLTTEKAPEKQP
jgi:hypothetical protein